jgi:hypothetical protein
LINLPFCPGKAILRGFLAVLPEAYYQRSQDTTTAGLYA